MSDHRSQKLRVALVQMDCELGDVAANVDRAIAVIEKYRDTTDLIAFPELALTGYSVGEKFHQHALAFSDELFQRLLESTRGTSVAMGMIEETPSFTFYNSLAFLTNGAVQHVHRKIFLPNYGKFEERKYFAPGPTYSCLNLGPFRIAPLICGDAWDPALANLGAADRANLYVMAVNSPEGGLGSRFSSQSHWKRVMRFYASLYGSYVLFVNRVGTERDMTFWGGSEIVDPFGDPVGEPASDKEQVITAELDLAQVRESRLTLNTVRDQDLRFIERRLREIIRRRTQEP